MTGYRSSEWRHSCDRHGCFINALPDWDDIVGCFAGKVIPTDIDAMVERHDRFLFLEQKRPGALIPAGQYRALRRLAELGPRLGEPDLITVKFIRPSTDNGWTDVLTFPNPGEYQRMSRPALLDELRIWDGGN